MSSTCPSGPQAPGRAESAHVHHRLLVVLVGPVVHARQAVAADGDAARALVPRQHQDDAHVGEPGAQALVVVPSEPGDGCCDDAWVGLQVGPRIRSDLPAECMPEAALCAAFMSAGCRHPSGIRSSHQSH